MKYFFVFVFLLLILIPNTAFGWKSLSYQENRECKINCGLAKQGLSSSEPTNFIFLTIFSVIGLGIYYKLTKTEKYDTFSVHCKRCGGFTSGLKCIKCQTLKEQAI